MNTNVSIFRKALQIMSHAFNSKQLSIPCSVLKDTLRLENNDNVIKVVSHYGLQVNNDQVFFRKADFKTDVPLVSIYFKIILILSRMFYNIL